MDIYLKKTRLQHGEVNNNNDNLNIDVLFDVVCSRIVGKIPVIDEESSLDLTLTEDLPHSNRINQE